MFPLQCVQTQADDEAFNIEEMKRFLDTLSSAHEQIAGHSSEKGSEYPALDTALLLAVCSQTPVYCKVYAQTPRYVNASTPNEQIRNKLVNLERSFPNLANARLNAFDRILLKD